MSNDESTSFDAVADFYDESAPHMFADSVVTPVVDLLAELAGSGRTHPFRADLSGMSFDVYEVVQQGLTSHHFWIGRQGMRSFASEGRYVWPAELDLMAKLAGMRLGDRWGGWKREPFTDASRSHVSIYQKV